MLHDVEIGGALHLSHQKVIFLTMLSFMNDLHLQDPFVSPKANHHSSVVAFAAQARLASTKSVSRNSEHRCDWLGTTATQYNAEYCPRLAIEEQSGTAPVVFRKVY